MKTHLLLILIMFTVVLSAQENKIVKILNEQLKKEIKNYPGVGDSITLIQPFKIDENNILQFQVSKFNPETNETEFITQQVSLEKITGFIKDINVIFVTDHDAVTVTTLKYDENGQEISNETYSYYLFFTQINQVTATEIFRDKILNAFTKAGYYIGSEFWAD